MLYRIQTSKYCKNNTTIKNLTETLMKYLNAKEEHPRSQFNTENKTNSLV